MLQVLIIVLLAVTGSIGGIWAGHLASTKAEEAKASDPAHGAVPQVEFLTPELFVIPLVSGSNVDGYFVCRLVIAVDPSKPAMPGINEDTLLADQFHNVAFKSKFYSPADGNIPDVSGLVDALINNLNEMVGNSRYTSAYVQQIDVFNRDEVRQKVVEDRFDSSKDM